MQNKLKHQQQAKQEKKSKRAAAKYLKYGSSLKGRFRALKYRAKKHGVECALSMEQFIKLQAENCYYCNKPRNVGEPQATWLDQIRPSNGYTLGNVRPCCGSCNRIKSNTLNEFEMLMVARLMAALRKAARKLTYDPVSIKTFKQRLAKARRIL